jgi:hypothetical protein
MLCSSKFGRLSRVLSSVLLALCGLVALSSCGGGSSMGSMSGPAGSGNMTGGGGSMAGSGGCTGMNCGMTYVTLTDATGDFMSYTVAVTSLALKRADGTLVETLPAAATVDFTQLVDLSELVSAAAVPSGEYVGVTLTLDYSHAAIYVNVNGNAVQATPLDANGQPLTTISAQITLDDAHHLNVAPGAVARLALDFNLAESNTVNTSVTPPTVTVQPFLVASVVPLDQKQLRVRGSLVKVDASGSSYTIALQPFDDDAGDHTAQLTVTVTAQTSYEINGTSYAGSAGLTALAALPAGTMTVAFGTLTESSMTFTAASVEAGSSVVGVGADTLSGTVIARSANLLTVRGGFWFRSDDEDGFESHNVMVAVGPDTSVTEQTQPSASPGIQSISVGQHIDVWGKAGTDGSGGPTLDATAGRVRLDVTRLTGTVAAPPAPGPMGGPVTITVTLSSLDGVDVSNFNFAGTGSSSANDANPKTYLVTIPVALPATGLAINAPVRLFGFVTPFGSAPPDFAAQTLVNYSATQSLLLVSWGDGTATPFTSLSGTGLVLNASAFALGAIHFIETGPTTLDLTTLSTGPTIVPDPSAMDMFAIQTGSHMQPMVPEAVYQDFSMFEAALAAQLNGTNVALGMIATGRYDPPSNTFTATRIGISLKD